MIPQEIREKMITAIALSPHWYLADVVKLPIQFAPPGQQQASFVDVSAGPEAMSVVAKSEVLGLDIFHYAVIPEEEDRTESESELPITQRRQQPLNVAGPIPNPPLGPPAVRRRRTWRRRRTAREIMGVTEMIEKNEHYFYTRDLEGYPDEPRYSTRSSCFVKLLGHHVFLGELSSIFFAIRKDTAKS